jgi:predicted NAD/FAD-binding protein
MRQFDSLALDLGDRLRRQAVWRQRAGAVARMDAGLLDMLHHACHDDIVPVADRIHVDLDRIAQIAVDQHRAVADTRTAVAMYVSSWAGLSTISIARPPST